jgi:hypothetical protein
MKGAIMQLIEHSALYSALKTKDTHFDGQFFVGVSSTGIYCRPICHAKLPKSEDRTFYATAADAEQAGALVFCADLSLRRGLRLLTPLIHSCAGRLECLVKTVQTNSTSNK